MRCLCEGIRTARLYVEHQMSRELTLSVHKTGRIVPLMELIPVKYSSRENVERLVRSNVGRVAQSV